ncbi:MAG: hypothetical protein JXR94_18795 [Candidatus Hydrogenedentes bacterium]|nr:hypothetical protein [Candidatus Hydrogenedentota bacterium]
MAEWTSVLELDSGRAVVSGGETALTDAIRRGADLRIYTEFLHNEHIDVNSDEAERILEVAEFGVTYLVRDSWAAGIMSLRQPILLPVGFGPRPSMSFFLYNQNGEQGIARPYLDGLPATGNPGASPLEQPPDMPKYHVKDSWDSETNAPSSNFVYDFDVFRYCVCDTWREVLAHDADGAVVRGSLDALVDAFTSGCALKVGVSGLCAGLAGDEDSGLEHELFAQAGPGYYYTGQKLFMAGSHPVIRVKPHVPVRYETRGWDFGWLMLRTDGHVVYRRCDPYSLAFEDIDGRYPVRWFVR